MPRIPAICMTLLVASWVVLAPPAAWAGGTGQVGCPAGFTSYIIPDDSLAGIAGGAAQVGRHGQLAPTYLPAGQYAVEAEGDTGPADNPPNAPYLALCRNNQGKPGTPILASAQGHDSASYEVPLSYMQGGPAVTAWLPAGMYRAIFSDASEYATIQTVQAGSSIAWWRYALLALGVAGILAFAAILPLMQRHNRKQPPAGAA